MEAGVWCHKTGAYVKQQSNSENIQSFSLVYLFALSLVTSPALRLWGHSCGQRWPFRPLESCTKNEPASPGTETVLLRKAFCHTSRTANCSLKLYTTVITNLSLSKMPQPQFELSPDDDVEHTLDGYSWFPEHIWVLQQLCLVSVDSDNLAPSVEDSTITQAEVAHRSWSHPTDC